MNREFNPTSRFARAVFAAGSFIISLLLVSSITSLAQHYSAASVASAEHVEIGRNFA
jgi:hypothetical protein